MLPFAISRAADNDAISFVIAKLRHRTFWLPRGKLDVQLNFIFIVLDRPVLNIAQD